MKNSANFSEGAKSFTLSEARPQIKTKDFEKVKITTGINFYRTCPGSIKNCKAWKGMQYINQY